LSKLKGKVYTSVYTIYISIYTMCEELSDIWQQDMTNESEA